jgi:hypothetical protein
MPLSDREGFPLDVLPKEFHDSFVGDNFGASIAESAIAAILVEFLPR